MKDPIVWPVLSLVALMLTGCATQITYQSTGALAPKIAVRAPARYALVSPWNDGQTTGTLVKELVVRGYVVIPAYHYNEVVERSKETSPAQPIWVFQCNESGTTSRPLGATSQKVECMALDLISGDKAYSGLGEHMGMTTEADFEGAVAAALADLPAISGGPGGMARDTDLDALLGRRSVETTNSGRIHIGQSVGANASLPDDAEITLDELITNAKKGSPEAQHFLGLRYLIGNGVRKDPIEAMYWVRKAAEQGCVAAQFSLGFMLACGQGVAKDSVEAARWYRMAAEQGNAEAQYNLGLFYRDGEGVDEDQSEAVYWFRKAAEQGNPKAQHNLAARYATGKGVAEDQVAATYWYREAAEQGLAQAQYNLGARYASGEGVLKDPAAAAYWFRKAADQEDAPAQLALAGAYLLGEGVTADAVQGMRWLRKAAEQGLAEAQYSLGAQYASGEGVLKDPVEAVHWYRKAAEQEHAQAQSMLGAMYASGEGVPRDATEAARWYRRAAEQGEPVAQYELGIAYANGDGVVRSPSGAAEWFYKAGKNFLLYGFRDEALGAYDAIVRVAPNHPLAQQLYEELHGGPAQPASSTASMGTGWLTAAGYVVTCQHVVAGFNKITVIAGGKKSAATVVAADRMNDLALLRLEDPSLVGVGQALPLAADLAPTGSSVFTVGFPHPDVMGVNPKITEGVISGATGFQDDPRTYQISVPVQEGNSGGPLLNMKGEVVGIVTSKINAVQMFQWTGDLPENVNYAVKTAYLKALLDSVARTMASIGLPPRQSSTLEELTARVESAVVIVVAQ